MSEMYQWQLRGSRAVKNARDRDYSFQNRTEAMRPLDKAEIARHLKGLRRRSLLTQLQLAELIGICRQAVSDIENKRTLLHPSTWDRFAALEAKHKLAAQIKLPAHWR
jgi:DNA-binding XRE family transcriptional regulator